MTITQQKTEITQQSDDKAADIGIILRLANNGPDQTNTVRPADQAIKSIADFSVI